MIFRSGNPILTACLLLPAASAQSNPKGKRNLPQNYSSNLRLANEILDELFLTSHNSKADAKKPNEIKTDPSKPKPDLQTGQTAQQALAAENSNPDPNLNYDGADLVEWINSNGGYIHPNARIGLDATGKYRGVFVKSLGEEGGTEGGIQEDEIICRIPCHHTFVSLSMPYLNHIFSLTLQELYNQFLLGDKSFYAPYVNYLMNQPRGRIISEWSEKGKKLLYSMLDKEWDEEDNTWIGGLPPKFVKSYEEVWLDWCKGEDTPLAKAAFYQFTSRDEDTLMVPFYDMCNHSNDPEKLNTINSKPRRPGKPFVLRATRDIKPGEQIYISYTRCNRCWHDEKYQDCTTWSHYSSSDMFDIFGFVEDFPQTWAFEIDTDDPNDEWDEVVFCLEHDEDSGTLLVTFGDNYSENPSEWIPTDGGLEFLHSQLARLNQFEKDFKDDKKLMEAIPKYEWEMSWRYHEALMTAISAAIVAADIGAPQATEPVKQEQPVKDSADDDDEEDSSDDDDEDDEDNLVPRLSPGSDEL
ncbi:hypothetical protein HJC23_004081 [Cyclotella cryptica]|uniref:SET domain-containing protein n=1 Tax=Cyclotella cryptica TaxID=29204 RepID=A0ABD3P3G4_9STRA